MNWTLEVVVVPVSDLDRAKAVLRGAGRVRGRSRHGDRRRDAGDPTDAARLRLLDRDRQRDRQDGARVAGGHAAGGERYPGRPGDAGRSGAWRSARCSTTRVPRWSTVRGIAGTRSSSSRTRTATAGRSRSARPVSEAELTAERFVDRLRAVQSDAELAKIQRYFKSGAGEYGEGDTFLGVRMGDVFALAKEFIDLPPAEIERLLESRSPRGAGRRPERDGQAGPAEEDAGEPAQGAVRPLPGPDGPDQQLGSGRSRRAVRRRRLPLRSTNRAMSSTSWPARRTSGSGARRSRARPTSSARARRTTRSGSPRSCSTTPRTSSTRRSGAGSGWRAISTGRGCWPCWTRTRRRCRASPSASRWSTSRRRSGRTTWG